MAPRERSVLSRRLGASTLRHAHGIYRRINNQFVQRFEFPRFFEKAEGKAGCKPEANMCFDATLSWAAPVGGDLGRERAYFEKKATLIRWLICPKILHLNGVGRRPSFVVEDFDLDQVRATHLGSLWQTPFDLERAKRKFAHQTRHDDEREHHAKEQIEQVVAGVDCRKADAKRDPEEVLALARELEFSWPPAFHKLVASLGGCAGACPWPLRFGLGGMQTGFSGSSSHRCFVGEPSMGARAWVAICRMPGSPHALPTPAIRTTSATSPRLAAAARSRASDNTSRPSLCTFNAIASSVTTRTE